MQNKEKIFSFRWDIDHLYCLDYGVPNILAVCRELDVKCTFYINMGKAFNLKEWLLKSPAKSVHKLSDTKSINIIKKIGYFNLLKVMVFNPNIGLKRKNVLKQIIAEGHELGLHGAMDHMLWSRRVKDFPEEKITKMLKKSIGHFRKSTGEDICGFSSPGFSWSKNSVDSLEKLGFQYNVDAQGEIPFRPQIGDTVYKQICVPVSIIGPDTIPIVEYNHALGKTDSEILKIVEAEIRKRNYAVIYGHPLWEGMKPELLRKIFLFAKNSGYSILTHKQIYERFKNNAEVKPIL